MRNFLIYFALKYQGDYFKILKAIKDKESVEKEKIEEIKKLNIQAITIIDENYPIELKQIMYSPIVLFYRGNENLLKENPKLAVIGSRNPSSYGEEATKKVLDEFLEKKECVIVSGLAHGIDALSHQCALNHHRKTIAILGCGIDYCYPKQNLKLKQEIEKNGLVISEYPFNTKPKKEYFQFRNRLISGLSKAILVTNAKIKSGTQITVRYGLEQNKDIFVIPHSILEDSFCNELLKEGAIPICQGLDLIDLV